MSTKYLSFSIQGEFITETSRQKLFEKYDLKGAINLLTGCLQSDKLTDAEINNMALDILNGKARIAGTYPSDDYRFEYIEGKENATDIADFIAKMQNLNDEEKKINEKFTFIQSFMQENYPNIAENMHNTYMEMYEENLFPAIEENKTTCTYGNSLLKSYMERMQTNTEDDYGWLEPNGTFHPVEWGEHEQWAQNWVSNHMSHTDWFKASTPENESRITHSYGDYLIKQKWILLHNPAQGIATPTKQPESRMTKAQKEYLYQYYIDRNQHNMANQIWKENTE